MTNAKTPRQMGKGVDIVVSEFLTPLQVGDYGAALKKARTHSFDHGEVMLVG